MIQRDLNVPNCISAFRILLVPALLALAWRRSGAFTVVLAASLLLDILDGYIARKFNQQTDLGAKLDSWGDFLTVLVYPFAAVWLRPQESRDNGFYWLAAAVVYALPILIGFLKYGRLTSYHTRLTRIAAYAMGIAIVAFFANWSVLPFRAACFLLALSQIEEIAITVTLPLWMANVSGFRRALSLRKELLR